MSKKVKKAAVNVVAHLEKLASFFEHHHETLGIPKKIAHDFSYRCDAFSDHIERYAGFDASSIGEVKSGPIICDGDDEYMMDHFTQIEGEELSTRVREDDFGPWD